MYYNIREWKAGNSQIWEPEKHQIFGIFVLMKTIDSLFYKLIKWMKVIAVNE